MTKFARALIVMLFVINSAFANEQLNSSDLSNDTSSQFDIDFTAGYREDNLNWKTTFVKENAPDFVEKMTWKDISLIQVGSKFRYLDDQNLYTRGSAYYSWGHKGDARKRIFPSGYDDFGKKHHPAHCVDIDLGLGFWRCPLPQFLIAPVIGVSLHVQKLKTTGSGTVKFVTRNEPLTIPPGWGSLTFLDWSPEEFQIDLNYSLKVLNIWKTGWVGFDSIVMVNEDLSLRLSYELHYGYYNTKIRESYVIFRSAHQNRGTGIGHVCVVGLDWYFLECWSFNYLLKYQNFMAMTGSSIGEGYKAPYSRSCWNSLSLMLGATLSF
jgi:hypothetical protein